MIGIWTYFLSLSKFYFNKNVILWVVSLVAFESFLTKAGFNGELLVALGLFVLADSVTGFYGAFRRGEISSKGYAKFIDKFVVYGVLIAVTWVIMRLSKQEFTALLWSDDVILTALIFRELISVVENLGKINNSLLPSFLLKYLKQFNEEGQFVPKDKDGKSEQFTGG
jgi:phage-related holin